MKTLAERISFLVSQRPMLEPWVGSYDEAALKKWLDRELGDHRRLEQWVDGFRDFCDFEWNVFGFCSSS